MLKWTFICMYIPVVYFSFGNTKFVGESCTYIFLVGLYELVLVRKHTLEVVLYLHIFMYNTAS